jgi:probable phosphoglycerate mutase
MGLILQKVGVGEGPWVVLSSPLGRAFDTARIVCEAAGLIGPIETDDRLAELSVGPFEGMTRDEILAHSPDVQITPGWIYDIPGGETEAQLRARLSEWLAEVDETDGRRRLVVSHGIAGRMLRHLYAGEPLQGQPPPQDSVFRLANGRIEPVSG